MATTVRHTHTVPTHLNTPETVLSVWAFNLSARQLLLLLVGGSLAGNLWHQLTFLSVLALGGQALRVGLALLPFLFALFCAWFRAGGRPIEIWVVALVRYWTQPKRFVWRSARAWPASGDAFEEMPSQEHDVEGENA